MSADTAETALKAVEVRPLTPHDLCKIIPPHSKKEAEELVEDIRKNKLQVPIKTFEELWAKVGDGMKG
jgi:hypothetical protein